MVMPSQHSHTGARLPVPDPDSLVITGTYNPWAFVMELHSTNVVKVPMEREEAAVGLVIPYLNLVIITCIITLTKILAKTTSSKVMFQGCHSQQVKIVLHQSIWLVSVDSICQFVSNSASSMQ
jgi:hypothetical protein